MKRRDFSRLVLGAGVSPDPCEIIARTNVGRGIANHAFEGGRTKHHYQEFPTDLQSDQCSAQIYAVVPLVTSSIGFPGDWQAKFRLRHSVRPASLKRCAHGATSRRKPTNVRKTIKTTSSFVVAAPPHDNLEFHA